jgi:hypothetical protein
MSQVDAVNFVNRVAKDTAVQKEVSELTPDDMNGLLKIANRLGFGSFTKEEYYEACATSDLSADASPLSMQELDQVVGGQLPPIYHPTPWKTCGYTCGCK